MTPLALEELYREKKGTVDDCLAQLCSGDTVRCANSYNEAVSILSRLHEIAFDREKLTL